MATERMVTRTVKVTVGECMVVDISKQLVTTEDYRVHGVFKDNGKITEAINESLPEGHKVVTVLTSNVELVRYGMTEKDFINNAMPLPLLPANKDSDSEEG